MRRFKIPLLLADHSLLITHHSSLFTHPPPEAPLTIRRIPIEAWLFALVLAVNLYAACVPANSLMSSWFTSDDAFYYFKTAQNISEGRGITFDGLGRDSGFHPLWMAMLVPLFALARFDLILPLRLVVVLSGLLSAGTAVILYRLAKRALSTEASILAAIFFAFSTYIHNNVVKMGLESGLSGFFLALLFYRLAVSTSNVLENPDGRLTRAEMRGVLLTGLVAALAVLARLDNVFFVLAAGAWIAIRPRRMRALLALDLFLIVLGVLWSYFTRVGFGPHYAAFAESSYWMAALALVVRLPLYYLFGLYQAPSAFRLAGKPGWWGPAVYFARALLASAAGSLVLSGLMLGLFGLRVFPGFPRLVLAYEAGFALAALLLTRLVFALVSLRAPANPETIHWRPSITRGVLFAAPLAVTLLVYMSASLWYFGTPMPVSGQIKRWWGTLPNPIYGKPAATVGELLTVTGKIKPWGLAERIVSWPKKPFPAALRLSGYTLLGGYLVYKQRKRVLRALQEMSLLPLFTGAYIHIISYTGTGYIHMRSWYWTAQMMLVTLVFAIFLDALLETLSGWASARAARRAQPVREVEHALRHPQQVFTALLGALFVLYCAADIIIAMPLFIPAENEEAYLGGIQQMEDATEPGSIIGSTGGGGIAYFVKDRVIVNMDGLMNTAEYYHMLQDGTAREYLDRIGMQYVFTGAMVINHSDPYFQFKDRLEWIREYPGITLFRWLPGD